MSTTYGKALFESARIVIVGSCHAEMWADIGAGAIAVFALFIRMVLLAAFPISIPVLMWLIVKYDRLKAKKNGCGARTDA